MKPFLDTANRLCGGILPSALVYQDGEFGWTRAGKFVRCERPVCSGTEEALAWCALSLSLATKAPLKLVLLDEIGRLDPAHKSQLLERVCDLQAAGELDQVLLVDANPPTWVPRRDNLSVIELR